MEAMKKTGVDTTTKDKIWSLSNVRRSEYLRHPEMGFALYCCEMAILADSTELDKNLKGRIQNMMGRIEASGLEEVSGKSKSYRETN